MFLAHAYFPDPRVPRLPPPQTQALSPSSHLFPIFIFNIHRLIKQSSSDLTDPQPVRSIPSFHPKSNSPISHRCRKSTGQTACPPAMGTPSLSGVKLSNFLQFSSDLRVLIRIFDSGCCKAQVRSLDSQGYARASRWCSLEATLWFSFSLMPLITWLSFPPGIFPSFWAPSLSNFWFVDL